MHIGLTAGQVFEIIRTGGVAEEFDERTIQYWTREGVLQPLDPDMPRKRFAPTEALVARACAQLFLLGCNVDALRGCAQALRPLVGEPLAESNARPDRRLTEARRRLRAASIGHSEAYFFFAGWRGNGPRWSVSASLNGGSAQPWASAFMISWHVLMKDMGP